MAYGLTTVSVGDPCKASHHNGNRDSVAYLQGLDDADHDFDTATGTGYHNFAIGATPGPQRIEVQDGVVWSRGWWEAANGSFWLLVNTASVASFARGDAEFYIQTGNLAGVPAA